MGEMTKAGFPVPQGFCVTTWAYRNFVQNSRAMMGLFDQLERINSDDLEQICKLGQRIRELLNSIFMPEDIQSAVLKAWETAGIEKAYAVRSSATAEDLPTASEKSSRRESSKQNRRKRRFYHSLAILEGKGYSDWSSCTVI